MRNYIIRRLLLMVPTILIVSLIVFAMMRLIPGTLVDAILGQARMYAGGATELNREAIEASLGLDAPILTQYGRWIGVIPNQDGVISGIFQGDFGKSLWRDIPVLEEVGFRWPVTLELGVLALIIAQLIALPIGIYSALRQDSVGDYISRSFAIICIAVPSFWIGTMVIVFTSVYLGYMPPIMHIPFTEDPIGNLEMFIIPAVILGMAMSGTTMRMTRTMMLEVLRQDYIRTAWAKGLRERVIILRHALKNALIPVITVIGFRLPVLVGGTVIIEYIFCLPGMGSLLIEATTLRDYTVVSGVMFILACVMVFINLAVDLTYGFLDPRVRYG